MKIVYIDLENLLKERGISKNKVCENCRLQRTQLNNYCQNKVSRIDLNTLAKLCEYLDCTPNDILKIRDESSRGDSLSPLSRVSKRTFTSNFSRNRT